MSTKRIGERGGSVCKIAWNARMSLPDRINCGFVPQDLPFMSTKRIGEWGGSVCKIACSARMSLPDPIHCAFVPQDLPFRSTKCIGERGGSVCKIAPYRFSAMFQLPWANPADA